MSAPILKPGNVSRLQNIRGVRNLDVMFSPAHIHSNFGGWRFAPSKHEVHEVIQRTVAARECPLWWNCYATLEVSPKAIVRNWVRNRTRVAFRKALETHGFDHDGYRKGMISNQEVSSEVEKSGKGGSAKEQVDLYCTVNIKVKPSLVTVPFTTVQDEANLIVEHIMALVSQRKARGFVNPEVSYNFGKRRNDEGSPFQRLRKFYKS